MIAFRNDRPGFGPGITEKDGKEEMGMARRRWTTSSAEEWRAEGGPLTWRMTFPGQRDQVARARHLVELLFAGTGREEDAGLIVTELAANAVCYTRSGQPKGWFGVDVSLGELAYLAVTDLGGAGWLVGGPKPPRPAAEPDEFDVELGGRGLLIVSELATAIGIHGSPDLGHTIWTDLDLSGHADTGTSARRLDSVG
ncbi:hypothetical protein GCM10027589_00150 [Actinocorallia lasiicapitis]